MLPLCQSGVGAPLECVEQPRAAQTRSLAPQAARAASCGATKAALCPRCDARDLEIGQAAALLLGVRGNHRDEELGSGDEGLGLCGLGGHRRRGLERVLEREGGAIAIDTSIAIVGIDGARGVEAVEREGLCRNQARYGRGASAAPISGLAEAGRGAWQPEPRGIIWR